EITRAAPYITNQNVLFTLHPGKVLPMLPEPGVKSSSRLFQQSGNGHACNSRSLQRQLASVFPKGSRYRQNQVLILQGVLRMMPIPTLSQIAKVTGRRQQRRDFGDVIVRAPRQDICLPIHLAMGQPTLGTGYTSPQGFTAELTCQRALNQGCNRLRVALIPPTPRQGQILRPILFWMRVITTGGEQRHSRHLPGGDQLVD